MGEEKQAKAIARVKVQNEFKFSFPAPNLICFGLFAGEVRMGPWKCRHETSNRTTKRNQTST